MITNDCICCAERRLIKQLQRESFRKGVKPYKFAEWIHRKYGTLVVARFRRDGQIGTSLPCVLCRKAIDKSGIQWMAYDGNDWVHSSKTENLPKSIPTNRQRRTIFSS